MHLLRPFFLRTSSSFSPTAAAAASSFRTTTQAKFHNSTMTSSTAAPAPAPAALQEWLVIVPDQAGALEKRIAIRPRHIEGLKGDREDMWLWGGAMLEAPIDASSNDPPRMKGSACLIGAATREEVVERLKRDVYVSGGVWDLEKVQIIPFRSALRKAL
ncbi:hypothetical protein EJ02DRAFT_450928 [Clathrospora elynae]|uniref:YCII-related domain-containing protein n=1 Tax=Clathrospora elynae TaxID=706981 RepID=A0A6A5T1Y7_9PLEO|nr:hypothetical protein EJ02DRAFT_450928 [Clathrospora elynae]